MYIKKLIKLFFLLFLLFFSFVIFEMSSISNKYINRSFITFEINNVRNPLVKKLVRSFDNLYSSFLLNISVEHKKYLDQTDNKFNNLPKTKIIYGKKNNFTLTKKNEKNNLNEWLRSHGNHSSNRFSDLKQINLLNVDKLKLAWVYKFDEINRDIQSNPIFADNKIFLPTTANKLIAINFKNGKKLWEYKTKGTPARRGLVYWSANKNEPRIYFCAEKQLISINPKNGKLIKSFGKNGIVNLKRRCKISPAIINENLIIATVEPALEVYNILNGKLLWKYYLKKTKNNKKRYGGKRYDYSGGNPWGGISADVNRKIVFITTGNAGFYFDGINRPGDNKYSNSIIAIDIKNKKKLWDFQEISHDIWNLDIPAPPILTSITKNDIKIDVVVAVTKLGNTIILDRLTGEPIFDFHKKKAPRSKIPGEKTAYYQPNVKIPEPFAKQTFGRNEITNISNKSNNYIKEKIKNANYGFFKPHELDKENIFFGFHGGAEWMGASVNHINGTMFITSHNIPWITSIKKIKNKHSYYEYEGNSERLFDQDGYPGSKPPWGTLTSLNLNNGKIIWQVPFGEYDELTKKNIPITGTENYGGATGTAGNIIFATGTVDKKIRAFDSTNGNEVWSYQLKFAGSGPPTTFFADKKQYVIVASTGSFSLSSGYKDINYGNLLYCFYLEE